MSPGAAPRAQDWGGDTAPLLVPSGPPFPRCVGKPGVFCACSARAALARPRSILDCAESFKFKVEKACADSHGNCLLLKLFWLGGPSEELQQEPNAARSSWLGGGIWFASFWAFPVGFPPLDRKRVRRGSGWSGISARAACG